MDGEVASRPPRVAVQDIVAGQFGQACQRVITARPVPQQPPEELAGFSYLVGGGREALGPGASTSGHDGVAARLLEWSGSGPAGQVRPRTQGQVWAGFPPGPAGPAPPPGHQCGSQVPGGYDRPGRPGDFGQPLRDIHMLPGCQRQIPGGSVPGNQRQHLSDVSGNGAPETRPLLVTAVPRAGRRGRASRCMRRPGGTTTGPILAAHGGRPHTI
jgi:hypothetical protein